MQTSHARRRLNLERLEAREVLTGNVTAAVVGGNLVITGDTDANYLFVWQDVGGDWMVAGGRQLSGGSPVGGTETNVNGSATVQSFANVTGGLQISLLGGNDEIEISNGDVIGASTIDLGDGDNHLILTEGFELAVPRFERNDAAAEVRGALEFSSTILVTSGTGNDSVYVEAVVAMQDDLSYTAGAGNDFLRIVGTGTLSVGGDVLLTFGTGDDVFNSLELAINVTGNFTVTQGDAGSGGAEVRLTDAVIGGDITITGAAGRNFVKLDNVDAGNISISLGAGADEIDTIAVLVTDFTADLGAGDDRDSTFADITATGDIEVIGGLGLDVIPLSDLTAVNITITGGDDADAVTAFDFVATTVSFDTGAGTDVIGVYRVTATTLSVLSGDGDDGGGFIFGLVVGSCTISGTLTVNSGAGLDNVLIGSMTAATANVTTGLGSDGLIVRFSDINNATINTGDSPDVVGCYDTVFDNLDVLLGAGLDQLWLGTVSSSVSADLNGETDGGEFYEPTTNSLTGEVTANLTPTASP